MLAKRQKKTINYYIMGIILTFLGPRIAKINEVNTNFPSAFKY